MPSNFTRQGSHPCIDFGTLRRFVARPLDRVGALGAAVSDELGCVRQLGCALLGVLRERGISSHLRQYLVLNRLAGLIALFHGFGGEAVGLTAFT